MTRLFATILASLATISAIQADPKPAAVFGDHMVLQQGMPVVVWGTATPGEKVTVSFRTKEASATADDKGSWSLKLDTMMADQKQAPSEFKVAGTEKSVVFKDVLVGEVWLCAGQSNMQWNINQSDAREDAAEANFPLIRHRAHNGQWTICDPKTVGNFTAVGFYFARSIYQTKVVPVGLLNNAIGGTRIEPWMSPASATEYLSNRPEDAKINFSNLYKSHTEPLKPYAMRGMLWYQGESNGGEGETYYHKLRGLVSGMRYAWGQGDFSFYNVQLPNFTGDTNKPEGGDGFSKIREAEAKALDIKNSGMAVIIDVGEARDIHPKNKKDVGERLARWALVKDYAMKDIAHCSPMLKEMKIDGSKARVSFNHVEGGLIVGKKTGRSPVAEDKEGKLKRFAIAGEDKKWVWADAVIEGDSVVVSSPDVAKPVAVRYAYSANPDGANLYSKSGLPAAPFRTDDWASAPLPPKKK
ncbi:MAG: sialate O-acetylesterase [Gemmataceae bacterium]|nr:sialate O-acetylesterase [Gemmataceae bacterium]